MHGSMLLLGRILLASIFAISGVRKAMAFSATAQFMAAKGLPYAEVLLAATIALELIGSLMLVMNVFAPPAALALAAFCIVAGLVFHNPWTATAAEFMNQFNHFLKNVALAGGLLVVAATSTRS